MAGIEAGSRLALERWLYSWPGPGAVVDGMSAQSFDVELKQFPAAWRARSYPTGVAHSIVHGGPVRAEKPRAACEPPRRRPHGTIPRPRCRDRGGAGTEAQPIGTSGNGHDNRVIKCALPNPVVSNRRNRR